MPTHKKSTKRKHSQDVELYSPDPDDRAPRKKEGDGKGDDLKADADAVVPSPTTKKPKLESSNPEILDPSVELTVNKKTQKKAKKKKKRSKQKSNSVSNPVETEEPSQGNGDEVPLEGCMIDDQMVLLDRVKGKVYSMTERLDDGDYLQIGTVGKDGKITLSKQESGKTKPLRCFSRFFACIEAGVYVYTIVFSGQISC
jgi:hypothetical protein